MHACGSVAWMWMYAMSCIIRMYVCISSGMESCAAAAMMFFSK